MIGALIRRVHQACCLHPHRVRERRDTPAASAVLFFVCDRCGDAVPAIDRTTRERLHALKHGRRVGRGPQPVVSMVALPPASPVPTPRARLARGPQRSV